MFSEVNLQEKAHWVEVKLISDGEIAEALAEVLGRFVSNGIVVETVTTYDTHLHENVPTGEIAVSGYLTVDSQLEDKKRKLEEALWHMSQIAPIPQATYTLVQDENWMAAWKKHYTPISVGENILILPAWHEPEPDNERVIIRINPAMAFGTGTHPTTQLCLKLLERYIKPDQHVFDIGCGSGILSIAALKMGAQHVLAVDVDSAAITSTLENTALNNIDPQLIETGIGSVNEILSGKFEREQAPLVLVNILATVILKLFEQGLGQTVSEGGTLLLSGILDYQEADILNAAQNAGFTRIDRLQQEDWISLAMVKHAEK